MTIGGMRQRRRREWIALLLLPALAFRLLVPAGFMPEFGADGSTLTVQMCHGDARSAAVMRLTTGQPHEPSAPETKHDAPCVFAATAGVAPLPVLSVDVPLRALPQPAAQHRLIAFIPSTPHRPQSARAPPIQA